MSETATPDEVAEEPPVVVFEDAIVAPAPVFCVLVFVAAVVLPVVFAVVLWPRVGELIVVLRCITVPVPIEFVPVMLIDAFRALHYR